MAESFNIDVTLDPAKAQAGANKVVDSLSIVEQHAAELRQELAAAANLSQAGFAKVAESLGVVDRNAGELRQELAAALSIKDESTSNQLREISEILQRTEERAIVTDARISQIGKDVETRGLKELNRELERTKSSADQLKSLLKRVFAGVGIAFLVKELKEMTDAATNVRNRLRLVTTTEQELVEVNQALFDISNRTRSSFEGTATIFSRLAVSSKELGVTNRELLGFTQSLNQAIILSGASAQESSAALIQLSQGMASGTLRGDELRSVLEQLPAVADVIAQGLGVTRGELRKMGEEGKITAQAIIKSFRDAGQELNERFATTVPTIGQSFTVLGNKITESVSKFDQATGASATFSKALIFLAENIETVIALATGLSVAIGIKLAADALPKAIAKVTEFGAAMTGAKAVGIAAFAGVAVGVTLLTNKIQKFNEDLAAIEEAQRNRARSATLTPFAVLGDDILRTRRQLELLQASQEKAGGTNTGLARTITELQGRLSTLTAEYDRQRASAERVTSSQQKNNVATKEVLQGLKDEAELLKLSGREREIRQQIIQTTNELQKRGVDLNREINAGLKEEVEANIRSNAELRLRDEILQGIRGPEEEHAENKRVLKALLDENVISLSEYNKALKDLKPPDSGQNSIDVALENQNRILEDIKGPMRDYNRDLRALNALLFQGRISQTEFNEAVADLKPPTKGNEFDEIVKSVKEANEELKIRATTQGFQQDALLLELEIRRQIGTVTDDQRKVISELIAEQRKYTTELEKQDELAQNAKKEENREDRRRDALLRQVDVIGQLRAQEEELLRVREASNNPELVSQIDRALEDLKIRQLEASTELGAGFERAFLKMKQEAEDLAFVGEQVANVFADKATDAIIQFAETGEFKFREFAASVLSDITRILARLLVMQIISASFGGGGGAAAGLAGAIGGGRQFGGTTQPGQAPFPVGENGPELFVPNRTGTIVPNPKDVAQPAPEMKVAVINQISKDDIGAAIASGEYDEIILNRVQVNKDRFKQVVS